MYFGLVNFCSHDLSGPFKHPHAAPAARYEDTRVPAQLSMKRFIARGCIRMLSAVAQLSK